MCYEGTVVGEKIPEDGVNDHRNVQEQEYVSEETQCSARQLVNKRITYVLTPHMLYVKFFISCFQFTKKLMNMQKTNTPRIINLAAKLGTEIVSNSHTDMLFPLTFILIAT